MLAANNGKYACDPGWHGAQGEEHRPQQGRFPLHDRFPTSGAFGEVVSIRTHTGVDTEPGRDHLGCSPTPCDVDPHTLPLIPPLPQVGGPGAGDPRKSWQPLVVGWQP